MISNKHNLPAPFVALFGKQQYSKGDSHWSVTQLVSPPKIAVLRAEHAEEIAAKEDLSDRFWSLMGSNIHKILEGASAEDHVVEERIHTTVHGMRISGQIDVQRHQNDKVGIIDYKFTSVYSVSRPKPEWEQQLNAYAFLLRKEKRIEVESLHVCAILRDWRLTDVARRKEYPPAPVVMVEIPVWSYKDQTRWVEARVMGLMHASSAYHMDDAMPECSDEDRWLRDGEPIRCRNYCDVSEYCNQWRVFQQEEKDASKRPEVSNESGPAGGNTAPKKTRSRKNPKPVNRSVDDTHAADVTERLSGGKEPDRAGQKTDRGK